MIHILRVSKKKMLKIYVRSCWKRCLPQRVIHVKNGAGHMNIYSQTDEKYFFFFTLIFWKKESIFLASPTYFFNLIGKNLGLKPNTPAIFCTSDCIT
jgi:hypothetical protein